MKISYTNVSRPSRFSLAKGSSVVAMLAIAATFSVSGFFAHTAHAQDMDGAVLGVTQITATQTFATADDTYADGWKWIFDVTVPDNQTLLKMKFADWVNGSNIIPAGGNIQFYSSQSTNAFDEAHAIGITASSTWSDLMDINPNIDLDTLHGGRQIQIIVEARVPSGSAGGSYSTSYGINTTATSSITIGNTTQTYDGMPEPVSITTDPLGLATHVTYSSVTYSSSTTPPTHVGTYTVYAEVTDPGYTGTSTATLTIKSATVSVVPDPKTKVYDGSTTTDPVLTYVPTPSLFDGDSFTGTLTRDPGEDVGSYNITQGTLALDSDYTLEFSPSTFTVTPATGTVTLGDLNQTYDKTGKSVSTSTDPLGLNVDVTYDGSSELPVNAGTYDVVATIADGQNYAGSTSTELVISPASLTVTATTSTKVYDGNTSSDGVPTITSGKLYGGDTTTWTQTFDTKDVGTDKTLTAIGTPNDDNNGNNYSITFVPDTTGSIISATATVTATGRNKVYDGTTTAMVDLSVQGAVGGDQLTATDTATFNTKDVGTGKLVTVTGITVSGPGVTSDDYTYNTTATTTADITAASLTITANDTTKVYGATTTFTGNEFTPSGLLDDDSVTSVTLTSDGAASTAPVSRSPYTITASDAQGVGLGNYSSITYIDGHLTVTPKPVMGGISASDKPYDGNTDASTTCSLADGDVINGDVVSCDTSDSQFDTRNAGTDTVTANLTLSGNDMGNYSVNPTATTTADITPLPLTVTAVTDTRLYNGTTTSLVTPDVTGTIISPDAQAFSESFNTKDVGTDKILTPNGMMDDGNGGLNYTYNFETTTGEIDVLPITVTALSNSKVYDGNTSATAIPTIAPSLVGTDTAVCRETYDNKNVGNSKTLTPSCGIDDGVSGADYTVTPVTDSTGIITPAPLTVSGLSIVTKVYDGGKVVTLTGTPTLDGVIIGDILHVDDSHAVATFNDKNVGNDKPVTVSGISFAGGSLISTHNYTLTQPTGLTGDITPLALVGTITDPGKVYDGNTDTNAACSSLEKPIAGDSVNCVVSSARFDTRNAGTDTVTADLSLSGNDAGNYSVNQATTTAVISALPITITAVTDSKPYDGTTYSSGIPTITLGALISPDSGTLSQVFDSKDAGSRELSPSIVINDGNGGNNYATTTINTQGTITQADQTITIDQSSIPTTGPISGNTFTLKATTTSGLSPLGFTSNTPDVCTIDQTSGIVTIGGGGIPGDCSLTVNQTGDNNYNSASASISFFIQYYGSGATILTPQ